MKTLSRILAATALVSVVGCGKLPGASLGGTFGVEPFINAAIPTGGFTVPGQVYSAALGREYQALARIAATEDVNWIDASAYMRKGYAALRGEQIQPWAPSVLGLSGEANSVYQRVITTINANAGRNPVACARALALYDNYVEELSEGAHACTDPAVILAELDEQLTACGYAEPRTIVVPSPPVVVPAPPVYVAPPPPPVVEYVAPPPPPPPPPPVVEYVPPPAPVVEYVPPPAPEPVYVPPPAPVVPYDACSTVSVPGNCTCDGASGNPVLTCEKIVTREVVREVEVPVPTEVIREVIKEVQVPYTPPPVEAPAYVAPPPPPPPPPPAAPSYPLNYTIYFGYDRYDLTAEARQVIDEAVAAFRAYAAPFMDIIGHTDSRGSKSYNTRLAQRRADAVAGAVSSRGVDRSSLRVSASSELDPAVTTGDGVREALNRRVSISIVQ